ncbi:MAG: hypothetical protein WB392_13740 [Methanotrichaceae archaeon]
MVAWVAGATESINQSFPPKPISLDVLFENLPQELKAIPHWVVWKYKWTGTKWNKPPFQLSGDYASTTDPDTWTTYEAVKTAYEAGGWDGVGFVLTDAQGIVGIDLDDVLVDGQPTEEASKIIETINSYTEISPSGAGIRIFLKGSYDGDNKKVVYTNRYLTLTGHTYEGHNTIEERTDELDAVFGSGYDDENEEMKNENEEHEQFHREEDESTGVLEDRDVIRIAKNLTGDKFEQLMAGNWESLGYPSSSEARLALLDILAYYCDGPLQIDRIFRQSGLYQLCRGKWGRLAENEIGKAMSGCKGHYKPSKSTECERKINISEEPRLNIQVELAMSAMNEYNSPPTLFKRSGELCRVAEVDYGSYRVERLENGMIRQILAKTCRWTKWAKTRDGFEEHDVYPPMPVVEAISGLGEWPVPWLSGVTTLPIVRPDGSVFTMPGFDDVTTFFFARPKEFKLPPIPETPTKEDAEKAAKYLLDELLGDFPFVDEASRTNALAALITPIARPMIEGCTPLALIDKTMPGTGASLLVDVIAIVATGRASDMTKDPGNEEEWRKTLFSLLYNGKFIICFDNVDAALESSTLSQVLTSTSVENRILGKTKTANVPNRSIWLATGNQLHVAGDIARRCYLVQMDAKMPNPWTRASQKFKHPELKAWAKEHRAEILAAIYTMIRAWVVAGKPACNAPSMGNFSEWRQVLGGILQYAGIRDFIENAPWRKELDFGASQWEAFVAAFYKKFNGKNAKAQDIVDWIENDKDLKANLPDEIDQAMMKASKAKALSKCLDKKINVRYQNGYMLAKTKDAHTKAALFSVVKYADKGLC